MIALLCFFLTLFARSSRRADLRSECRAFDLHSLTLVLFPILRDTLNGMRAMPSLHRRRGAHFSADQWRRLRYRRPSNWGPRLSDAADGFPPRKLQAFRLKPSPAFGWLLLQFSFLLHGRSAKKLGSVTSSHAPKRRSNVRFMSERHPLHL